MKLTGIGIDYSNICKDYNTAYLDRDNKDPDTSKCMKQVTGWMHNLLSDMTARFGYTIYHLHSSDPVKTEEVASNRFLFYSLEKEITLQSYVLQKTYVQYETASVWAAKQRDSVLIQNDADGEGVYLFMDEDSEVKLWLLERLADYALDDVAFPGH